MHRLRRPFYGWFALVALALHLLLPLVHAGTASSGTLALAMCSSMGQQVQLVPLSGDDGQAGQALVKTCPICAAQAAHGVLPLPSSTQVVPLATHLPPPVAATVALSDSHPEHHHPPAQGPPGA
ncbi:DUF2946 family protein [Chitinolyticbacter meiyuanensis]|uniref:DUF2946 family protein n=1 Tax=Chitinolyticbacter meiyuanensis TaxID=682798 RepID=UPI0011E58C48|nr:DUF2946 family protein [Chitinolyticbacter meiyuanensis]